jgi:hypothetical protein
MHCSLRLKPYRADHEAGVLQPSPTQADVGHAYSWPVGTGEKLLPDHTCAPAVGSPGGRRQQVFDTFDLVVDSRLDPHLEAHRIQLRIFR